MSEEILIANEVAEILRVDKQRVWELVRTNRIPVIRIGQRQYRFSRVAIQNWLTDGGNHVIGQAANVPVSVSENLDIVGGRGRSDETQPKEANDPNDQINMEENLSE